MARPKRIRITKNDVSEYKRLAKNTQAKISRTYKKYGVDLSSEISTPKLEDFKTRKEYNKWKEEVRQFTNRANTKYQFVKNEYGVVASKQEINKVKRETKQAQNVAKRLQKETAKKPFISGGKKQGTLGQRMMQMGKPSVDGIFIPKDFEFDKIRSREQFELKSESMNKRAQPDYLDKRQITMKENYLKLIDEKYNSDGETLKEEIEKINPADFFELFLMHDELQFEYEYTEEQTEANLQKKLSIIESFKEGKVNMDLKGF